MFIADPEIKEKPRQTGKGSAGAFGIKVVYQNC